MMDVLKIHQADPSVDCGKLTFIQFSGILARLPILKRMQSNEPLTPSDRVALKQLEDEL